MRLIMVDSATQEQVDDHPDWQGPLPREGEQLSYGAGVYANVRQIIWDMEDEQVFLMLDVSGAQEQPEPIDEKAIEKAVGKVVGE